MSSGNDGGGFGSPAVASPGEFSLVDDLAPPTRVLTAYQVGENDIVAAYDPAGAIKVLCDAHGYPDDEFTEDDVELVGDGLLDTTRAFCEEAGWIELETTLRQDVAALTEPAYMFGWE